MCYLVILIKFGNNMVFIYPGIYYADIFNKNFCDLLIKIYKINKINKKDINISKVNKNGLLVYDRHQIRAISWYGIKYNPKFIEVNKYIYKKIKFHLAKYMKTYDLSGNFSDSNYLFISRRLKKYVVWINPKVGRLDQTLLPHPFYTGLPQGCFCFVKVAIFSFMADDKNFMAQKLASEQES